MKETRLCQSADTTQHGRCQDKVGSCWGGNGGRAIEEGWPDSGAVMEVGVQGGKS